MRPTLVACAVFVAACGSANKESEATVDAGSDAGTIDAGTIDAGTIDAGTIDAGTIDAGTIDAGTIDAGTIDAGLFGSGAFALLRMRATRPALDDAGLFTQLELEFADADFARCMLPTVDAEVVYVRLWTGDAGISSGQFAIGAAVPAVLLNRFHWSPLGVTTNEAVGTGALRIVAVTPTFVSGDFDVALSQFNTGADAGRLSGAFSVPLEECP